MSKVITISEYIAKRSQSLAHVNCPLCDRLVVGVQSGALAVYRCDGGNDAHRPLTWDYHAESVVKQSSAF
jgi:hypothetical protein